MWTRKYGNEYASEIQSQITFAISAAGNTIEALFGELKNCICLRRTRLRRLKHVREGRSTEMDSRLTQLETFYRCLVSRDMGENDRLGFWSVGNCRFALLLMRKVWFTELLDT